MEIIALGSANIRQRARIHTYGEELERKETAGRDAEQKNPLSTRGSDD